MQVCISRGEPGPGGDMGFLHAAWVARPSGGRGSALRRAGLQLCRDAVAWEQLQIAKQVLGP